MSVLRLIYLCLAVVGTVVPMLHYLPWARQYGFDPGLLVATWKANPASTALYYDILISAIVLNVWIVAETYVRKDYWVLICLPLTYLVGVSCGLPLFLFLRSRSVR